MAAQVREGGRAGGGRREGGGGRGGAGGAGARLATTQPPQHRRSLLASSKRNRTASDSRVGQDAATSSGVSINTRGGPGNHASMNKFKQQERIDENMSRESSVFAFT